MTAEQRWEYSSYAGSRGYGPKAGRNAAHNYKVGDKLYFSALKSPFTVKACDERYLVCTKPYNFKRTVHYTIVDFLRDVRGEDDIRGAGYETAEECAEALALLNAGEIGVTFRNYVELDIAKAGSK